MDQNLSLVPLAQRELTPGMWGMIERIAVVFAKSGKFGVMRWETAAAILLKGFELGIGFSASFEFIQDVNGKIGLSPRGALALLHNAPQIVQPIVLKRLTDKTGAFEGYECTMTRVNGFTHTERWTLADAKRAGLIKAGGAWEAYPENLAKWRAVGFCADVVAPDITAGSIMLLKAPEQFGVGLTEEGDIIDMVPTEIPMSPFDAALADLLNEHDADAILAANGGNMPATLEEVEKLAALLRLPAHI